MCVACTGESRADLRLLIVHICVTMSECQLMSDAWNFQDTTCPGCFSNVWASHQSSTLFKDRNAHSHNMQALAAPPVSMDNIAEQFKAAGGPKERAQLLLELAKSLPSFPADARTMANRVMGCTAQVSAVQRTSMQLSYECLCRDVCRLFVASANCTVHCCWNSIFQGGLKIF